MVITEYNEEVFVNGIRNEGFEDGVAQGRSEGQSDLVKAVELLRQGKTAEELVKSGIDKKTVELAVAIN